VKNLDSIGDQLENAYQMRLRRITHILSERVKELDCLYGISRLFENSHQPLNDTLQNVVDLIPRAWQFPHLTCARILLRNNKQITTVNFTVTPWFQSQFITVNGKRFGALEVYYLKAMPDADEGPFLSEERKLLRVIAERLGHIIETDIAQRKLHFSFQREHKARERLQSEIETRIDFTRRLIHELKTPLTSLMATSQLLREEMKDPRLTKLADYIWNGVNNMNGRIEELYDVARGELGILQLSSANLHIKTLLLSTVEETTPLFDQHGITPVIDIDDRLPIIWADASRLRQVLLNLFNNVCKYAAGGKKIVIRASRSKYSLKVEVKDFGPGIDPEKLPALFEPGLANYSDVGKGGLGIGLPLCRVLINLHGGKIWCRSRISKGTSFFFSIPLNQNSTLSAEK
jgi:signal transduction histidine kinase